MAMIVYTEQISQESKLWTNNTPVTGDNTGIGDITIASVTVSKSLHNRHFYMLIFAWYLGDTSVLFFFFILN